MKQLNIRPVILSFDIFKTFAKEFKLGKDDLILTNEYIYKPFIESLNLGCKLIFQEKYGVGEPSDTMVDQILEAVNGMKYNRVIAVGGGTIIDIAKVIILKKANNVDVLYDTMDSLEKEKELIIIPTTCGTGSEVTNIAVLNRTRKGTKMGLVSPSMYADYAVLITEFLSSLPYSVFATSSIDALIHAVEAFLGPKRTSYTEVFAISAINIIIKGYCDIVKKGKDARFDKSAAFLTASNYAGIAFCNSSCAAVHAMSYAFGGKYHVAHGESNYQFFTDVLKTYQKKDPNGKIKELEVLLTQLIRENSDINTSNAFEALDTLLTGILTKKRMGEYGAVQSDIKEFAESTIANQQRLLSNNYVNLSQEEIQEIYQARL